MEKSLWWRIREVKLTGGFGSPSHWHISVSSKIKEVRRSRSLFWGSLSVTGSSQMWDPGRFVALDLKVPRYNAFQTKISQFTRKKM